MTERWRPEDRLLGDSELADLLAKYSDRLILIQNTAKKQRQVTLNIKTPLGTVSEVLKLIQEGKIKRLADDQELPELNAAYLLASGVSYPYEMVWDSRGYVHPWIMQFLKKQRDLISEAGYMKVVQE